MSQLAVAAGLFLLGALSPSAATAEHAPTSPLSPSSLLAVPERYAEHEVVVRGVVAARERAVFPNGRAYYTLSISDGPRALVVFSWEPPSVRRGESVQVTGTFHRSRFNIRDVVESRSITRLAGPAGPAPEPERPQPQSGDR